QGEQKARAATLGQRPDGAMQIVDRDVVLLEIDAGVAVDLEVNEAGREPLIGRRIGGARSDRNNFAVFPLQADGLAGGVMPSVDFSFAHCSRAPETFEIESGVKPPHSKRNGRTTKIGRA